MSGCNGPCRCATFREHITSLSISPGLREVGGTNQRDKALEADRSAYRALRGQGFQPPQLRGAYDLARRATSEAEIRMGTVIDERDNRRKKRGTKVFENMLEINDHAMTGEAPPVGTKVPLNVRRPV